MALRPRNSPSVGAGNGRRNGLHNFDRVTNQLRAVVSGLIPRWARPIAMIPPVTQPHIPADRAIPPPNAAAILNDTSGPMFHRSARAEKTDWEHEYPFWNRASAISVTLMLFRLLARRSSAPEHAHLSVPIPASAQPTSPSRYTLTWENGKPCSRRLRPAVRLAAQISPDDRPLS